MDWKVISLIPAILCLSPTANISRAGPPAGDKLSASDAEFGDKLGGAIAVAGDRAVSGASGENVFRGAAYLFDLSTGAELRKLTVPGGDIVDLFGVSVALSNKVVLVGASGEDGDGTDQGAAYVFDPDTGAQMHRLTADDAQDDDRFGESLALWDNRAVIGARLEDGGGTDRGAVYVFDLMSGNQLRKLVASDAKDDDEFGMSVAISASRVLVGARFVDGAGTDRGAAYVFDLATGSQLAKLTPSDPGDGDEFGFSTAISGNLAIVGARYEDGDGGDDRGAAYVFDLTTGRQLFKLTAFDVEDGAEFGYSVSLSGDLAVVGARDEGEAGSEGRGAVYLFDLNTGDLCFKLTASDGDTGDRLGNSVSISGRRVAAGAPGDDEAADSAGALYSFVIPVVEPDNRIGRRPFTGPGDDTYNRNAAGQTLRATSKRLRRIKAWFTIENDGDTPDDYRLAGSRGNRFFRTKFLRVNGGQRTDVTGAVVTGLHEESAVDPAAPGRLLCLVIRPSRGKLRKRKATRRGTKRIILRKRITIRLTVTSQTAATKADTAAVKARTR